MACTWFGEICSCCCLTVLLGPAWVLLSKIYKTFAGSLYCAQVLTSNKKQNLPLHYTFPPKFFSGPEA